MSEEKQKRTVSEEIEVASGQLVDTVKNLVRQGNIRRLIIRNADGKVLLDTPLTVAGVAGGALFLTGLAIPLAIVGSIAAVVTRVRIEIIREVEDGDVVEVSDKKKRVDIKVDEE
jgi:hypothetical protein